MVQHSPLHGSRHQQEAGPDPGSHSPPNNSRPIPLAQRAMHYAKSGLSPSSGKHEGQMPVSGGPRRIPAPLKLETGLNIGRLRPSRASSSSSAETPTSTTATPTSPLSPRGVARFAGLGSKAPPPLPGEYVQMPAPPPRSPEHTQSPVSQPQAPPPPPPPQLPASVRDQLASQISRAPSGPPPLRQYPPPSSQNQPGLTISEWGASRSPSTPVGLGSPMAAYSSGLARSVSVGSTTSEQYDKIANSSNTSNSSELTVEQFETVRRHALTQRHDPRAQLELAKTLCKAADQLASRYTDPLHPSTILIDERQQSRNREAWTSQAFKIAKRLATKSMNPDAMFFLGSLYSTGAYGIDMDYVKALDMYERAARLDHADASYRIAVCEEFGVGTRRDVEKAVGWYKKAAVLGNTASMYKLGMISMLGKLGQPRDFSQGLLWLQRASEKADAQNPHALHELGLLYERSPQGTYLSGDPLPKNDAKALEKFYTAAKLGYAPSQARLGRASEFGELGCPIDPQWSISWYSQAAQRGDADAELGMAGWYWTGGGAHLRKSDTEAFLWAERAATKGHMRALYALGYFYETGVGVPRDVEKAKKWYAKALDKKHPRAAARLQALDDH